MSGLPGTPKIEIEFVYLSGTWVDVSRDVDLSAGIRIHYGRSSPFQTAEPATLTLQLNNGPSATAAVGGRYTAGTQLLADGVTAHPYYPNLIPRRRIRVSWVASATTFYRYFGFIHGWPTEVENGLRPYVTINASCRLLLLSETKLHGWFYEEGKIAAGSLHAYYPMSDPAPPNGSAAVASFADTSGNNRPPLTQVYTGNTFVTAGAQNPMPQSESQTGASFQVSTMSTATSASLAAPLPPMSQANTCIGFWATMPATVAGATSQIQIRLGTIDATQYIDAYIADSGTGPIAQWEVVSGSSAVGFFGAAVTTGTPHYIQLNLTFSAGNYGGTLWVDGVNTGGNTISGPKALSQLYINLLQSQTPATSGPIIMGPVAIWSNASVTSGAPSGLNMWNAGNGFTGQLSGTRIQKLLTYGGLTSGEWSVDAGACVIGGFQTILGRDVNSCCQDIATSEGGGSVVYTLTDGRIRFTDRNSRTQNQIGSANMFMDAVKDLVGKAYDPAYDDTNLVNQSTVTRAGGSTQTWINPSLTVPGGGDDSFTSYATTDVDALNVAQYRVAAQQPQFRLGRLTVNFVTAANTPYSQLGNTGIGSWVEIDSLVAGKNAWSDVAQIFVEGWTETWTNLQYLWEADTSPAPVFWNMVWTDSTYGRWALTPGSATTALAANNTTTMVITTAGGNPTMSASAGDYPQKVKLNTEIITLVNAPGGSTSPQTFTGILRGQAHTRAAIQPAGTVVTLWPEPNWHL